MEFSSAISYAPLAKRKKKGKEEKRVSGNDAFIDRPSLFLGAIYVERYILLICNSELLRNRADGAAGKPENGGLDARVKVNVAYF